MLPWIATCALACGGVLAAESRGSRLGVWLCKPLAAAAFVALGITVGGLGPSVYGRWILLGLVLSWLGDVLLIPREREPLFLAGVGSFALAHLAYCAAFLSVGFSRVAFVGGTALVLPAGLAVLGWLRPHLRDGFAHAVPAYIGVIAVMVVLAVSAAAATGVVSGAVGALGFAVSDIAVARDRFVSPGSRNGLWGLPLYFASQLVLASSIAIVASAAGVRA